MDNALQMYKKKIKELHEVKTQIKNMLFLDYDLECLDDYASVCCILASLNKEKTEELQEYAYGMEIEMVITIGRSLDADKKKSLVSSIEKIEVIDAEIDQCKNGLRTRLRYLHNLMGDDLFFKFIVEMGCLFSLVRATPSEVMKYGIKTYGSPLLSQHPLVAKASPKNQGKLLRKLCFKTTIAARLDFCESNFEIDFYKQMEKIFSSFEDSMVQESSILKTPLARKATRRGGIRARQKRRGSPSPKKRKFLKLGIGEIDES
ncbi:putative snoRNA binding domain-containing protein [Encephalitozoon cuniculi]|nr:putative snoRNA binding domain-containing protein [Encephalitozoon cuniculi]